MPFDPKQTIEPCTICGGQANIKSRDNNIGTVVDCSHCGDFAVDLITAFRKALPIGDPVKRALARYLLRQMNGALAILRPGDWIRRPVIADEFFDALAARDLPTAAEAADNMLLYLAKACGSSPGAHLSIGFTDPHVAPSIGVLTAEDVDWIMETLINRSLFRGQSTADFTVGSLTWRGWERVSELRNSETSSRYAFFARKFDNAELTKVYDECLVPAVRATGFELHPVSQKAGLVDAIIEDEIRRCAFLLADLSDHNAGAYWEAGFAEGLGKPVIYICKTTDGAKEITTHFDANHRHTVRWDLAHLDRTANQLKAVIRNTLLGQAKQSDY